MSNRKLVYEWIQMLQEDPNNVRVQKLIVENYSGLVESLAYKYSVNRLVHEDLVQVGMIGLLAAIKRFDINYGSSFESFAVPTILGEIKRFIRDQTWSVHVPRRIKELGPKIHRAIDELIRECQKTPSITEIANYLKVTEKEVLEALEMRQSYHALSADRQIEADSDGGTLSIFDVVGEEDNSFKFINIRLLLDRIFPILSRREQTVLKCIFLEGMSQQATGELLGISQMHVSRLQRRSLAKLRKRLPMTSEEVLGDI